MAILDKNGDLVSYPDDFIWVAQTYQRNRNFLRRCNPRAEELFWNIIQIASTRPQDLHPDRIKEFRSQCPIRDGESYLDVS